MTFNKVVDSQTTKRCRELNWSTEPYLLWKSAHGLAPPHDAAEWSPALAAFVARCFEPDPGRRARARELRGDGLFAKFIQ